MNRKLIVWLVAAAIALGAVVALATPVPAVMKAVAAQELAELQGAGAWVIDVRTNSEYVTGHIPNALNVPLDQLQSTAAGWPKTQPIIVYCATGARSAEAATFLGGQGFKKVYDLDRGIIAWTGQVVGGRDTAALPVGPGVVKTAGKPVFIDFAGSA